jgi:outer membrane protein
MSQHSRQADEQKATTRLQGLEREIRALADKLKDQQAKLDDPTLSSSQRDAIRAEGQKTALDMQTKQAEGQQFMTKTQGELQQRAQKLRAQVFAEASKAAADVARRKGGTLVYDRSTLVYADPAYDITNDVVAEVAKFGKPAATK